MRSRDDVAVHLRAGPGRTRFVYAIALLQAAVAGVTLFLAPVAGVFLAVLAAGGLGHAFRTGRGALRVDGRGVVRCTGLTTKVLTWDDVDVVVIRDGPTVRAGLRPAVVVRGRGTAIAIAAPARHHQIDRANRAVVAHAQARRIPVEREASPG